MVDILFSQLTAWHWVTICALFLTLEMMLGAGLFLLWLGISALVPALLKSLLPALNTHMQLGIFALTATVSVLDWYAYLKKFPSHNKKVASTLNRRSSRYVGKVLTLETPIVHGKGQIQLEDSFWTIEGPDVAAGQKIKIIAAEGLILKVKPEL